MRVSRAYIAVLSFLTCISVSAEVLDPHNENNAILADVGNALAAQPIDVAFNLNDRDLARRVPSVPRLGQLADLPPLRAVSSEELAAWEAAYEAREIGALAFLAGTEAGQASSRFESFYERWLDAPELERVVISYHRSDAASVGQLLQALAPTHTLMQTEYDGGTAEILERGGRLFAVAGQRWVLDSVNARTLQNTIPEFRLLGESVRRDATTVEDPDSRGARRIAATEPAVFLKETLGDEFEASTIPEIIVPGGIAFGENAVFTETTGELVFAQDAFWWQTENGRLAFPQEAPTVWKAGYDFAARSTQIASDAIVDIDERGRVRVSSALRDTDLGYALARIDTEPFNYVTRLDVRKSVIIDSRVQFSTQGQTMTYTTDYEVRFLQADRMRIARTQAALVYRYQSADGAVQHRDSWGPDAFRLEGRTDFDGLGAATAEAARYAAWISLFRNVHENALPFSRGRYEFLKIDKSGRSTPARL